MISHGSMEKDDWLITDHRTLLGFLCMLYTADTALLYGTRYIAQSCGPCNFFSSSAIDLGQKAIEQCL